MNDLQRRLGEKYKHERDPSHESRHKQRRTERSSDSNMSSHRGMLSSQGGYSRATPESSSLHMDHAYYDSSSGNGTHGSSRSSYHSSSKPRAHVDHAYEESSRSSHHRNSQPRDSVLTDHAYGVHGSSRSSHHSNSQPRAHSYGGSSRTSHHSSLRSKDSGTDNAYGVRGSSRGSHHYSSSQTRDSITSSYSRSGHGFARSRTNPRQGTIKYLSPLDIQSLAQSSFEKVVACVNNNEAGFLAAYKHENCKNPIMMKHLIKLLYLLTKSEDIDRIASRTFARILSTDGSYALFIVKLELLIKEMVTAKRDNLQYLDYLLEIGSRVIKIIPQTILSTFPLLLIQATIERLMKQGENLGTLEQKAKNLDKEFKLAQERLATAFPENMEVYAEPPEHFTDLAILPSHHELHSKDDEIYLRKNLVIGSYSNWDHYLDVQYRLLREDFVRPLRHGIQHYCTPGLAKSSQDIIIYEQVHVLNPVCLPSGIGFEIWFDVSRLKRVNWEHSRRLIYGSLLCLSTDEFQHSMVFATVAKRDPNLLQEGCLIIKFEGEASGFQVDPNKVFTMVESTAYFEAYCHFLNRLQEISSACDQIPFKPYIIGSRPLSNILPPSYSLYQKQLRFDLSEILCVRSVITLHNESSWPAAETTCLDQSQLEALKMALTKEVSVIQGPPGTGKTFIGLKIVEAFLRNRSVWDRNREAPILVVCYTNHALDQFLEGILNLRIGDQTPNIVRIGGRCKNDKLTGCILRNKVNEYKVSNVLPQGLLKKWGRSYNMVAQHRNLINKVFKSPSDGEHQLLELQDLKDMMHDRHYQQLSDGSYPISRKELDLWLDLYQPELAQPHSKIEEPMDTDEYDAGEYGLAEVDDSYIQVDNEAKMIEEDRILEGEEIEFLSPDTTGSKLSTKRDQTDRNEQKKGATNFKAKPMSAKDAQEIRDVWMLPIDKRWQLYNFWCQEYERIHTEQYNQACMSHTDISREVDECVLHGCDVIGITTTGTAKHHHFFKHINPKVVIFEEAAEIFEAHIVTSLAPSVQQLVLIGDHKQLQPKPNCYDLEVQYNMSVSLFERLIRNGLPYVSLTVQHRMRPAISSLIHPSIYDDLEDHDSVKKCDRIRGIAKDVYFINHNQPEISRKDSDTTTHVNPFEADYLVKLCHYLLKQGYQPGVITILTMYQGQLLELKRKMRRKDFEGVRVAAVDDFQGEENDIILLSLVRSNPDQNIGFLKIPNRICVALSRAKKALYLIGNLSMLRNKKKTLWPQIIAVLEQNHCVGKALPLYCRIHSKRKVFAEMPEDFLKCPEGGCDRPCKKTLTCGHICSRICHTNDTDHANYKCLEVCSRVLPCGHECKFKCHECSTAAGCKPCSEVIKKIVSTCPHKTAISVKCSESNSTNFSCFLPCKKRLECGHACRNKCSEPCSFKCMALAEKHLPCGHVVNDSCYLSVDQIKCQVNCDVVLECGDQCVGTCGDCYEGRLHVRCQQKCSRQLVCGHTCGFPCASICPPCVKKCNIFCVHSYCPKKCYEPCDPCMEPCEWQCQHYKCTKPCGQLCNRPPCNAPCDKKLSCGHECISLCGEKCPDLCRVCNKEEVCEVFFGKEDDEGARFIKLEECGHLIEVTGLDKWIEDSSNVEGEIKFPLCPKCKTSIRTSLRYCDQVKKIERMWKK